MQERSWFCWSLDVFAMLTLIGAGVALGSTLWFADIVPESHTFQLFHGFLAVAIISFMVSRVAEMIRVISVMPDPKLQRAGLETQMASETHAVIAADASVVVVTEGKFSRAA